MARYDGRVLTFTRRLILLSLAVSSAACGGAEQPSPEPNIVAGSGFLRCDEWGHPFLASAWARIDVHAGARDLSLRVTRAVYILDGGTQPSDVYEGSIDAPTALLPAGTDTTLYFDLSFLDRRPTTPPRTYAIQLEVQANGRTWSLVSPTQPPSCKQD